MMARRDDITAQIEALQAEAAELDDGDHEVWIESDDDPHRRYKLTGGNAKSVLQRLGILPTDEGQTEGDEGQADDAGSGNSRKPADQQDAKPVRKGYGTFGVK